METQNEPAVVTSSGSETSEATAAAEPAVVAPAAPESGSITAAQPQAEAPAAKAVDPASVNIPDNWKSSLPPEFLAEPSMQNIKDVNSLAKGYIHAQKHIGANKMPIPGENSTADEWRTAFQKLGLPEEKEKYEISVPKDSVLDQSVVGEFKEKAFEFGVLPKQAEQLLDWFNGSAKGTQEVVQSQSVAKMAREQEALKGEWGEAYDKNFQKATMAVQYLENPDLVNFLNSNGLDKHPAMIKVFAKFGEVLQEDGLIGEGDVKNPEALTPDSAQRQIEEIRGDSSHPYHKKDHPSHAAALKEVEKLYGFAFPTSV